MIKFTEEKLEQSILELLGNEGFLHVHGGTLERASGDVLIREDLREYLSYRYAADGITDGEIEHIFRRLDAFSSADLYESNKAIMKMVSDGFLLKREDRSQKDLYVELIDYRGIAEQRRPRPGEVPMVVAEEPAQYNSPYNIFKAVNQLEIVGAEKRIPDCIVYINGLPLVVFEFKSAIREEATIHDAYVQLTTRYRRDIPELFKYNTFCVISDGVNSKMGSFFAPYEFFYAWRRAERNPHPQPLSQRARGGHYRGGFDFSGLREEARKLKQKQTPAEVVMGELLRNRKLENLKFRRQHQIGEYIVDFYCHERKLIVELDGEVHNETAQIEKDKKRTAYFETMGFHVLRFENRHFLTDTDDVLNKIAAFSSRSLYSPSPSGRGARGEGEYEVPAEGINSLYTMVHGLFNRQTLVDVIRNFIFMPDTSSHDVKIVCRYPQYYAARKLYDNIKAHRRPEGDGKGGTYFGATGCGKSFTMLFLTRLLMKSLDFSNPTIVLITDRTDLDDQLTGQFINAKGFIGDDAIVSVESREHLRRLLKGRHSGGVFLTTVHKFTEDTKLLTDRANIICISDEAHRSQLNLDQKVRVTENGVQRTYGFAKYLHDSLPNATYVGFTGTPIDATLDVFGEVIDAYTMTESVKDEITVRIVYEGRAAKVLLDNSKLQEIEEYYARCAEEGASEYAIEESKKANAQMNSILGDPDRLKAVAEDFVKHYEKRVSEGATVKGKAMFVCSSRPIAYELYKEIIALRPEWAEVKVCEEGAVLSDKDRREIKLMERIKMEKALVDKYNERKEQDVLVSNVLEDFTDEIIDLYQALKKEKESFADLGIDFEEKAFYDILKSLAHKYEFEYPDEKLIPLSKKVKEVVDDKAKYTDWSRRNDIKAELKADLIILLAEHGYPPVDRDEVYKEIFEQAENFKKYQSEKKG